ncbi:MAG TPA: hypothetical protein VF376_10830 [Thermoanaerobaculia bacterium]
MTARKTSATQSRKTKRLKIKKETIKDLDTRDKAEKVKGGVKDPTLGCQR